MSQPSSQPPKTQINPPIREITLQERQNTARTFWMITAGFVLLVGGVIAWLSVQGRSARDYGQEVKQTVLATKPSPSMSFQQSCSEALAKPLPTGIKSCEVNVDAGVPTITLNMEDGKQYKVK